MENMHIVFFSHRISNSTCQFVLIIFLTVTLNDIFHIIYMDLVFLSWLGGKTDKYLLLIESYRQEALYITRLNHKILIGSEVNQNFGVTLHTGISYTA